MPIHDWTRVDAGIFHDFHQSWIIALRNALNDGRLPDPYYAMAEQVTAGPIPEVVTLERIDKYDDATPTSGDVTSGSLAILEVPPRTQYSHGGDLKAYAGRATRVAIRHVSGDHVIGCIEIISPGNKHSDAAMTSFMSKLAKGLEAGCHQLIIDLHPPSKRDPDGIHALFWQRYFGDENAPRVDGDHPLGMTAYRSWSRPTAYFEPFAVGDTLIDMPVFLTPDRYVNVSLEETYMEAWRGVPKRWKQVVDPDSTSENVQGFD